MRSSHTAPPSGASIREFCQDDNGRSQAARFVGLGVAEYVPPGGDAAADLSAAVRAALGRAVLAAVDEASGRVLTRGCLVPRRAGVADVFVQG